MKSPSRRSKNIFTHIDFLEVELDLQVGVAPGVIVVVVIVGLLVQRGCHSPAVVVHFFYCGCLSTVVAAQMLTESAPMVLRTNKQKNQKME